MVTPPAFPTACNSTQFKIKLPSTSILSATSITISPACVPSKPELAAIPALITLLPKSPDWRFRLRALMVIFPPPVPLTSTSAELLKVTSAFATSSGKFKVLSPLKVTVPAADNPPNSIFPPFAVVLPASKLILPPTRVRFFPRATCKPTTLLVLFSTLDLFKIPSGLSRKFIPIGILICNNGGA